MLSGGNEYVTSGGLASASVVSSGGNEYVSSGGFAISTAVTSGGFQSVVSGGAATGASIATGAQQNVWTGGIASTTTLNGGEQFLFGGTAVATAVSAGGAQYISSGGVASGTVVSSGGHQYVSSGGSAIGAAVLNVGSQVVFDGGMAGNTAVSSGGAQYVLAGGIASGTTISSGGAQNISSGGTAAGTHVLDGGAQLVFSGAVASATTVGSGGVQSVSNGGMTFGTTVASGGTQTVASGGLVSGTALSAGAMQNVASGGIAVGTVIGSGGIQTVSSGGIATSTVLGANGTVLDNGTVIFDQPTTSTYAGKIAGSGTLIQQGVGTTIVSADNHAFAGSTIVSAGTLIVGELGQDSASLGGDVSVRSAGTLRGHGSIGGSVANGGTVMPGGTIGTLTVDGNYAQASNAALVIEVSPTSGSQLKVAGAATLAGRLSVLYDPGTYSARTYALLTANAIAGRFDSVSSQTTEGANLNGLSESVRYGATEVDLQLVNGVAVVAPIDTSIFTALGSTVVQAAQATDAVVLDRLATLADARAAAPHGGAWVSATGGYSRADGHGAVSGYGAHRYGAVAGLDRGDDRARIGGALGFDHAEIGESGSPDTGRFDALRLALYGSHALGPLQAAALVGYGAHWASQTRPFGSTAAGAAEGDHLIQAVTGAVQASLPLHFGDTVITPRAGLRWAYVHGQGYVESGAGGQDLAVGADTVHSLQPYAGISLAHAFGSTERPAQVHLDFTYAAELASRARAVTVFAQDGTAFAAPGASLARDIVSLGAGVQARLSRAWSISADASTQLRSGCALKLDVSYRY